MSIDYVGESAAKPIKFMVCNDGSPASILALDTVAHGLLRDEDRLFVASAWSK